MRSLGALRVMTRSLLGIIEFPKSLSAHASNFYNRNIEINITASILIQLLSN